MAVYCHDGLFDMSPRAACRLEVLGFNRVYDYVDGIADWKAAGLAIEGTADPGQRVIDAIRADVPTCQTDDTVASIRRRTVDAGWEICVVTDCDGMAIGRIRGGGFNGDGEQLAGEAMEPGPSTVRPDQPLQPLVTRMHERSAPHVIVTTPQGKLIGILVRGEADRLLAGEPPQRFWHDCDCGPGFWTHRRKPLVDPNNTQDRPGPVRPPPRSTPSDCAFDRDLDAAYAV